MYRSLFLCLLSLGQVYAQPETVRFELALDRGVLPAGRNQRATLKISLKAPSPLENRARPPVNLALVLDSSGSMKGPKLEHAKQAAIEAVKRLGINDRFSLVVYHSHAETRIPAAPIVNAGAIEEQIQAIRAGGSTALFAGVSLAAAEVRKNQDKPFFNRLLLLSDGLANVGPSSPEDLSRLGTAFAKESISVSTVGIGDDYNEDLMTGISQASDGNTYYVEASQDLSRIFDRELGDVLSVVARDAVVTIECPIGIKPLALIGREGRIEQQKVTVRLNQLYGGQEKFILLETEIETASAGEIRELATTSLTYVDAIANQKRTVHSRIAAKFSDRKQEVLASINREVQRASYLNLNAVVQDKAIELADRGQVGEAVKELKSASQNLRQAGEQNQDALLLEKAEEMDRYARDINNRGLSKKQRKKLRTDSYQQRNNQAPPVPKSKEIKPKQEKQ